MRPDFDQSQNQIGTLAETSLHAALKSRYAQPGDQVECEVAGHIVDIVGLDGLIEIQTGSFSHLKRKLDALLPAYPVKIVYPVPQQRWIIRQDRNGKVLNRRKSPKRGVIDEVFRELVRIPRQAAHPNFSLEAVFVSEEVIWRNDGRGSWRRKGWSIVDRRLLTILDRTRLNTIDSFARFVPFAAGEPFTVSDIAQARKIPYQLAGKMVYCLKLMGVVEKTGQQGRAYVYALK